MRMSTRKVASGNRNIVGARVTEALGSVLICTVMLADRFLFTLQDSFVLTTAIISAVLLTIGIRVVKRHDEENQN